MNSATVFDGIGLVHHEHEGKIGKSRYRREIAQNIDGLRFVERQVHGGGGGEINDRVAVRRRVDGRLEREIGGGAGLVLDEHRLAEPFGEPLGQDPRHRVGRAAGRIADDPAQRSRRIIERPAFFAGGSGAAADGCLRAAKIDGEEVSWRTPRRYRECTTQSTACTVRFARRWHRRCPFVRWDHGMSPGSWT